MNEFLYIPISNITARAKIGISNFLRLNTILLNEQLLSIHDSLRGVNRDWENKIFLRYDPWF